jgi:hypothetical protein|tara:strand:- start:237 stop:455 length:219 start_codon:yes stop_codon:yes gene_type:complete
MGCKSCDKNKKRLADSLVGNSKELGSYGTNSSLWNDSMANTSKMEKIVLTLFAWIPLCFGYYTIIRFFISLF